VQETPFGQLSKQVEATTRIRSTYHLEALNQPADDFNILDLVTLKTNNCYSDDKNRVYNYDGVEKQYSIIDTINGHYGNPPNAKQTKEEVISSLMSDVSKGYGTTNHISISLSKKELISGSGSVESPWAWVQSIFSHSNNEVLNLNVPYSVIIKGGDLRVQGDLNSLQQGDTNNPVASDGEGNYSLENSKKLRAMICRDLNKFVANSTNSQFYIITAVAKSSEIKAVLDNQSANAISVKTAMANIGRVAAPQVGINAHGEASNNVVSVVNNFNWGVIASPVHIDTNGVIFVDTSAPTIIIRKGLRKAPK